MCLGVELHCLEQEVLEGDDFDERLHFADVEFCFEGPYELQDIADDAADNTECETPAVIETVPGVVGERDGVVFSDVVPVFANKKQISNLSAKEAKEECAKRGLGTQGNKRGCVQRLKQWQDAFRPPKSSPKSAARQAELDAEMAKWKDIDQFAGHEVPKYEGGVPGPNRTAGLDHTSTPREIFDTLIPPDEVKFWSDWSNKNSEIKGFGKHQYKKSWQPWTVFMVYQFIATHLVHGLDPRPSLKDFFQVSFVREQLSQDHELN